MSQAEQEPQTPLAATRMNELGLENAQLAQRVGVWDVVETIWASPGTTPTSTTHVAERTMIGPFFQEIIQPAPGSTVPDFRRMYYLSFHRIEGCWKYVSLDTRNPVGLMPATSFGPGEPGRIDLRFEPFAVPGPGAEVTGQMLRMEETISLQDADHDIAEERFMMADGSGQVVLAYKYEYTRKGGAMATGEQNFTVTSSQFKDGDTMPNSAVHPMAGGQNISPDLLWAGAPEGTASFAVSMYDPDAPTTVGFAHWLLFNLDPSITSLAAGAGAAGKNPPGSTLGFTDFGVSAYNGGAAPLGDPPHHYIITVYALDVPHLDLGSTATYAFFNFSIRGHVLGRAQITAPFGH